MQWKRHNMFCYRSQAAVFLVILLGLTAHAAQAQQQVELTNFNVTEVIINEVQSDSC